MATGRLEMSQSRLMAKLNAQYTVSGGRGQLDSSRLPDDPCHRDVTISEARDFAGFRK